MLSLIVKIIQIDDRSILCSIDLVGYMIDDDRQIDLNEKIQNRYKEDVVQLELNVIKLSNRFLV